MKYVYKGMVAATLLATASLANAGTVSLPGGVSFEELPVVDADNGQGTFRSDFSFVQWWEDSSGTDTSLSTMFGGVVDPTTFDLAGYGILATDATSTGSFQCNGCEMTFTFDGLGLTLTPSMIDNPGFEVAYDAHVDLHVGNNDFSLIETRDAFEVSSGIPQEIMTQSPGLDYSLATMSIYLDDTPDLDIGVDFGPTSVALAENGTEWLTLSFAEVDFGVIVADADVAVAGLNRADSSFGLNATGGLAMDGFTSANDIRLVNIIDGFVDMVGFGLSANFTKDTVTDEYKIYAVGGTGNASGFAVTEPTSVAIFGLGLLGFAAASRRKSS